MVQNELKINKSNFDPTSEMKISMFISVIIHGIWAFADLRLVDLIESTVLPHAMCHYL